MGQCRAGEGKGGSIGADKHVMSRYDMSRYAMTCHITLLPLHFLLPDGLGAAAREDDGTDTLCPCAMSRAPLLSRSSTIWMCFRRASTSEGI